MEMIDDEQTNNCLERKTTVRILDASFIEFTERITGPLCFGYGCHFGLGMFFPVGSFTVNK
jgi:hypothetical protein